MLQEALKRETKIEHQAIEKAVNFEEVTSSKRAYLELIKKLYGFYSPTESQLLGMKSAFEALGFSLDLRLKKNLLEEDLCLMGLTSFDISTLPLCDETPKMHTIEDCLGVLYVLEGSTLGGQVIYRNLIEKNDFADRARLKFHLAYGSRTAQMWKEFRSILDSYPEHKHPEVILSANHTFQALREWIQK